jgi:hypothetical protein
MAGFQRRRIGMRGVRLVLPDGPIGNYMGRDRHAHEAAKKAVVAASAGPAGRSGSFYFPVCGAQQAAFDFGIFDRRGSDFAVHALVAMAMAVIQ